MAEFALGLTKTAVQGTLNSVKSAIEEEGKLRVRVQDDLVFISGEFRMMQSFLKASNAGGRASQSEVMQAWVKQLRDLAFEVEDCVEFVVHLDQPSPWDFVRRLTSPLMCMGRRPLPLDVAVADIKQLKVRVEDLSQRNTRYNLFSTSGGDGGGNDSSDQQQLMHVAGTITSSTPATMEVFPFLRKVWESTGKLIHTNGELKRLIDCEGRELKVISLWRSQQADVVGELGWVTIAKKAFDDPEICQEFKNRTWVKLSTHHPFNPVEFLNNLLSHFTTSRHHRHDNISELMLQVSRHRYLIVLETELSSVAEWDAIKRCLLDDKNGSRIVISTKHLGIALVCTGDPYQVSELKRFSYDRSLCAILPKGYGHRIGMGELFWQLRRRQFGVISLLGRTYREIPSLIVELYSYRVRRYRVFDGVKFKYYCRFDVSTKDGPLKPVDLALSILVQSCSEDDQEEECKKIRETEISEDVIIGKARNFLTEHDCLLLITNLESSTDWNLIKHHFLCESTRGYIIVITSKQSVATHCVDHKKHLVLDMEELMKGCGHRIGMSELFWNLKQHDGVVSLFCQTDQERSQLMDTLYSCKYRVFDGVKYGLFKLVDLALFILAQSHPEDKQETECQKLIREVKNDNEIIKLGHQFLIEHNCLLFITNLDSTTDWDLIKQELLCDDTIGYIVVITSDRSFATHCVDQKHDCVIDVEDLMKGCGHRVIMNELFWQSPCPGKQGVISLFWQIDEERSQLRDELNSYQTRKYRIFDGKKFEHCFNFIDIEDGQFKLVDLARFVLAQVDPKRGEESSGENSELFIIEESRKYLTEHNCLLFITNLKTTDWDLIKQHLLCKSTRCYIVVITKDRSVAEYCVDGKQDQVLDVGVLKKGCGHRIGMSELCWQLRGHHGVLSLFGRTDEKISQLLDKLESYRVRKYRIFDGFKFDQCYRYDVPRDGQWKVVDLALFIVVKSWTIDEQETEYKRLMAMDNSDRDIAIIEMSRKFLTKQKWLLFITNLKSTTEWNSIKEHLLSEDTKGYIVVVTSDQSVATHCVDHKQDQVLNIEDLMKDPSGLADGGGNTQEEGESEPYAIARDEDRERVFYDLHAGKKLSVWGIAGLGKSTLVKHHYNKIKSMQVYVMYGWVEVPQPFNLTGLCQRLLLDLLSDNVDAKEAVAVGMFGGQDPIQECIKILLEHKCLLVFDGLQSTDDWDLINKTLLSQPISGGTIIITRQERVARHCSEHKVYDTYGLEPDVALDLFTKIILNGKPLFDDALKDSEIMLSKCGGLPEVIIAIGKQIHSKAQHKDSLLRILKEINNDFRGYLRLHLPMLRGLFCWMQSYFDTCSDDHKPCIFYMSIFPADQRIRWTRLLRRWIAEGYSPTEKKAADLALELMKSSIMYYGDGNEISMRSMFRLNGFFLEYIKSQPMEHNRVFELDGSCSPSSRLTGQHLTIRSSWDRDRIVFKSLDVSRLRSFTVFGKWDKFLICNKMKLLRVLDLEGTSTPDIPSSVSNDDLEKIAELFSRLKVISLRGCIKVTRLPDSIGDMKQLHTLDAKNTSIVELPPAIITKLQKLQYIRVGAGDPEVPSAPAAPVAISSPPTPPQEDGHDGTSLLLRAKIDLSGASTGALDRAHKSCSRLRHFKEEAIRKYVTASGGGVGLLRAAAKGIGGLTELRTLGVVNVAYGRGDHSFLDELKKLTQLRKLALSGITRENWNKLCCAISGHRHLVILWLKLLLLKEEKASYDFARFDYISDPPMTIQRLKVTYTGNEGAGKGCAWITPTWIKQLRQDIRFYHWLTVSSQEDIGVLYEDGGALPGSDHVHLRIKPIEQRLSFDKGLSFNVLSIHCSGFSSTVTFRGTLASEFKVKELNLHCCSSCGGLNCLRVCGLKNLQNLEHVWVTGPCRDEHEQDLLKQLEEHPKNPELKRL
ncbi:hypothetical protein CFC21_004664 [Triticum aestivum]|uniref:Uncharacterized protein n=2 Tax=Triticum aestivum TaxID=4565 RepID=A0A3B5YPV1_WHEAT|nr:uncharacterized protein LOC123102691 [Triticum aestivum]KAF6986985.1 hypothetical protein CFC21_004664 [Triticum aestivum]